MEMDALLLVQFKIIMTVIIQHNHRYVCFDKAIILRFFRLKKIALQIQ